MRRLLALLFLIGIIVGVNNILAKDKYKDEPTVFGMIQGNTGCAILEQHMPVKKPLLMAGVVYSRTEYRVLETFNCKFDKQKFMGTDGVKELSDIAVKDKIKMVAIPAKHSDEQLKEARNLCQE